MVAGCTHFIIGRDMAGSKSSVTGEDFYGAYEAQEVAQKHAMELNMQTVPSLNITYTEVCSTAYVVLTAKQLFPLGCCTRHELRVNGKVRPDTASSRRKVPRRLSHLQAVGQPLSPSASLSQSDIQI